MFDITSRCSISVCEQMKKAITEAGGNEVFFAGEINTQGIVVSVSVTARGHETAVPVQRESLLEASVLIHNHPSGKLVPSDADLAIASSAAERAQGFYIIDNDAAHVYVVVEPVKQKEIAPLDVEEVCEYLSEGGPLSVQSVKFEERPSQIALLEHICRVFNKNQIGIFEAGTGVGKSYAYLIPAILWAVNNKERIIISTGTINLQQQLAEKDIPAAVRITGRKVNYVLVKGRQNYLCMRRLNDTLAEPDLFADNTDELIQIKEWATQSDTGSRSDLAFNPSESVWSRVCSEADSCMGMRCPFHDKCFVMRVRKEAAGANLIVVNHHLLFADIESRMSGIGYDDTAVLPPYRRVIFDEAHGIENAATSFFSERLSRFRLLQQLNMLYRLKRNRTGGLLIKISGLTIRQDKLQEAIQQVAVVRQQLVNLETAALDVLEKRHTVRLSQLNAGLFTPMLEQFSGLKSTLSDLSSAVRDVLDGIRDDDRLDQNVWEIKTIVRRLENCAAFCSVFTAWTEHDDTVFWLERRQTRVQAGNASVFYPVFVQTPLDIAPRMNSGVFEPMHSVVCTSATIRTGNSFYYWMRRVGISFCEQERICTGTFESPFPYERNMFFAVPSDVPSPDSSVFKNYTIDAVSRLIQAAGGRTLVLFTSYDSLRSVCSAVRTQLRSLSYTIFMQGDDDRARLLDAFRADESSVLFATDSFWEGIDVPGASLSQVIIAKLPFSVPDDPVFEARCEAVAKRDGNPFMELSVPEAVIKFRQGVGRLIRRSDDRGAVVVLDNRLIKKAYGRIFLESVPQRTLQYKPVSELEHMVERFLQ